ncbi:MAG: WD40 repeat domain-containing protein [Planctomycetota bacterium]|jgi:Tol biopolymer transport system component
MMKAHVNRSYAAPALVALLCLAGCQGQDDLADWPDNAIRRITNLTISPDGQTVAYLCTTTAMDGLPNAPVWTQHAQTVRWVDVDRPDDMRLHWIANNSGPFKTAIGSANNVESLAFSPNSERLAMVVRSPGYVDRTGIVILDVGTGQNWYLHEGEGHAAGLVWLSDDEVAYRVVTSVMRDDGEVRTLWIYRHRLGIWAAREQIFREPISGPWQMSWSPDRLRLIVREGGQMQAALLDIQTGQVTQFGPRDATHTRVSWRPDSSTALVVFEKRPASRRRASAYKALLVSPSGGEDGGAAIETVDAPDDFRQPWETLCNRWTADGEYVVSELGMMLIRPKPWEVIDLTDQVGAIHADPDEFRTWGGAILPLSVPGRLVTIGTRLGPVVAVDYEMGHAVRLAYSGDWALSPDGTWVVEVDKAGDPSFRPVDLRLPSDD